MIEHYVRQATQHKRHGQVQTNRVGLSNSDLSTCLKYALRVFILPQLQVQSAAFTVLHCPFLSILYEM